MMKLSKLHKSKVLEWVNKVLQLEAKLDALRSQKRTTKLSERYNEIIGWNEGDDQTNHVRNEVINLEATNADLLDVVRDCVNFLADLNSTSPFDSEYMVHRAKALHKSAYTAHSKAKVT